MTLNLERMERRADEMTGYERRADDLGFPSIESLFDALEKARPRFVQEWDQSWSCELTVRLLNTYPPIDGKET